MFDHVPHAGVYLGRDNLRNVIELKRSGGKKTRRIRAIRLRISDRVAVHTEV